MRETAYAKINLALHVRERRSDGYHDLETLFAFVDSGDVLSAQFADADSVTTVGPFAAGIDNPFDNLVAKGLGVLPRRQGLYVTLEKNLPVAAGLGGGSADAGAVFRMVEREFGLPDDWPERAAKLGADVPSCVRSRTVIGKGTGTEIEDGPDDLSGAPVLLVNPRKALSTAPVFAGWDGMDRGPLPSGTAREIALKGRNDLTDAAMALCPEIGQVMAALDVSDAYLVRMSGSGATCFALYENTAARDQALRRITEERPDWWLLAGEIR